MKKNALQWLLAEIDEKAIADDEWMTLRQKFDEKFPMAEKDLLEVEARLGSIKTAVHYAEENALEAIKRLRGG